MTTLRIATWNIHKGVNGPALRQRLEIHNIAVAIEQMDADVVALQEVRKVNRLQARRFAHWPAAPQADFLAPTGYQAVYETNAITRHGEHGNALLSRWPVVNTQHHDISDHRFEQRGFLHAEISVDGQSVHTVVVHLGLIGASRVRQVHALERYLHKSVPASAPLVVAGDFNDWGERLHHLLRVQDLHTFEDQRLPTYPARLPVLHMDRIYVRGLRRLSARVPHGAAWRTMSDHLPLIGEFEIEA
jgi:endonuclease/exonuclease/phosphatase family metal-dependent hydrolase